MITRLKPYAEYQNFAASWCGSVPSHWNLKRIGSIFGERGETNEQRKVIDILSVLKGRGVIPYAEKGRIGNKASDDIGRYKVVRPDDLVLNSMNVIIGSLGRSRYTGCLSPVYYVLRRRDLKNDPRYLELIFQNKPFHESLVRIGNGILAHRMRIPMEKLKAELIPLPPADEQVAIARFLAWTNGRLERAIRAKRKVISLLNEQKQAIIHRAVTRGLDPKVSLKPSGVPWIGDIPAHWELRRLKSLLLRNDGGVWGSDFTPEGTVVLRSTEQAVDGSWQIISPAVIRLSESQIKSAVLEAGDIVVTKSSGSATHIGKASLVSPEVARMRCCYSNFMQRLRTNAQLEPEYLHLFLNSNTGRTHYQYTTTSTTGLGNLTRETIATLPIPFPQPSEQLHILGSLKRRLGPLNESLSRLEREIDLLIEYRTSLVADVVTGKLDVRQAAANLPDETTLDTPSSEDESDYIDNLDEEAI